MTSLVRKVSGSSFNVPQISLLSHPLCPEQKISPSLSFRPEIELFIFNNSYTALLDSGASVSAMSENLYNVFKNDPSNFKIPSFPLSGIFLKTAITNKSVKINSQVYINFNINHFKTHAIFLIVPHLSTPLILGTDWLLENNISLNYKTREIILPPPNAPVPFKIISLHQNNDLINTLRHIEIENSDQDFLSTTSDNILPFPPTKNLAFNDLPLNEQQQHDIDSLLNKYVHIFQDSPGLHNSFSYKFNVCEHKPYKIKPYPVPFSRRSAVQQEIDKMLNWGVIERSDAPYNNPLVTVVKTDGSIRLCLDARKLNTIILPTRDSSPPIDEILAKFNNKNIFSSLDFTSGYWQVPLDPTVRPYTSFLYDGRSYQFCVVPFGLNISNAAFGKCLEAVLNNSTVPCPFPNDIHTYVDDILVSSHSFKNHLINLEWIFQKISSSGLTLKFKKCHFFKTQIKFLGHLISSSGTIMDPDKVSALKNFPEPRKKKDLQSFFGFCNFYRKFSQNHSQLLNPLSHLLKKNVPWSFKNEEKSCFNKIKNAFCNQVALTHPNFNRPFCIQTDASLIGLGAELFQVDDDQQRHTIAFASRSLCGSERNYSVTELELLAILFACQKFKVYILGYPINVYTDHKALTFLFSCKLKNARLTRWTLILQEFDLKIFYSPGKENPLDTLSRYPMDRDEQAPLDFPSIMQFYFKNSVPPDPLRPPEYIFKLDIPPALPYKIQSYFKNIAHEQSLDPHICKILKSLSSNNSQQTWHTFYKIHNNVLFIRKSKFLNFWSLLLPKHLVNEIIIAFHDYFGHVGSLKTIHSLKQICYFPSFHKTVRSVVKSCDICQKCKINTTLMSGPMQHVISQKPLEKLLVDFYGPLPVGIYGLQYIFVVLDNFSRFVKLFPLRRATAKACTNKLSQYYFPQYGIPLNLVSDHGRQFISKHWQQTLKKYHIQVGHTSVYHPQSNPAERVMRELGRLFRTYCNERHNTWPQYVPYIEWVLNNVKHESTLHSPAELFLNDNVPNPVSQHLDYPQINFPVSYHKKLILANEIQLSKAQSRKIKHDKKLNSHPLKVNDLVLVRTHKLSNTIDKKISKFFILYEGPYKISSVKSHNAYTLVDPHENVPKGTHNIVNLKKYHTPSL